MRFHTLHAAAVLLAAAAPFALAQTSPTQGQPDAPANQRLSNANVPTTTPDDSRIGARKAGRISHAVPPLNLVDEPIASVSKSDDTANAIVQAMNGDASLKGCKITVLPDQDRVTLTGTALTNAQVKRAGEIATQAVGEGKVVNTILAAEV